MSFNRRHTRFPMRLAGTAAGTLGLLAGAFCTGTGLTTALAAEREVLAVVSCDSYGDLKKQLGWLGKQVGQPTLAAMLESVLLMATQGRGLNGLDLKRPLGAVVSTDGGDLAVHGFIPVKSLDNLLDSLQAVTGPVAKSGDSRGLTLPNGMAIDIVERDGWAIVSPRDIDAEAVDPAPLLAPIAEYYTLGIRLFPHRLPEQLRLQLRMLIEQAAANAGEQGQQLDGRTLAAVLDSLADTESFELGIAIDAEKDRLFIENRTVAVPGSPAALAMQGADRGQSSVPMPPAVDGKRPAVSAHLVQSVPEASRRQVLDTLDQVLPPGSDDRLTQTVALLLRDVIASVLATGGIDAALSVDTPPVAEKDAAKAALPAVTAGIRVQDGAAVEKRVKTTFSSEVSLPPGVDVKFDTGKVGTTNLHTITVDLSGTEAAESLGKSLELTLAVGPEYAFLMAGGEPRRRLAEALGPAGKADPQAKPIVGVDVALDRVLAYAAQQSLPAGFLDVATGEGDATADGAEAGRRSGGGNVRLLVRPIERGVATRLSADGAALRLTAAGAGEAAGPGGPPGLPVPNGFPLPIPAR